MQLFIHQSFSLGLIWVQPSLCWYLGVAFTHVQDLVLGYVDLHKVHTAPILIPCNWWFSCLGWNEHRVTTWEAQKLVPNILLVQEVLTSEQWLREVGCCILEWLCFPRWYFLGGSSSCRRQCCSLQAWHPVPEGALEWVYPEIQPPGDGTLSCVQGSVVPSWHGTSNVARWWGQYLFAPQLGAFADTSK